MTEEGGDKSDEGGEPEPDNEPVDLDELASEPLNEPVDLDQLAPEPEAPAAPSHAMSDAARAQAVARKLVGAAGRRGALGRHPSSSGEAAPPSTPSGDAIETADPAKPALASHPSTGGASKGSLPSSLASKQGAAAGPALSAPPPTGGRRPLVDPSQRKQKPKHVPFYARMRIPAKPFVVVVLLAALGVGGWFGWKAVDRSRHADEYSVRDELFQYKFDRSEEHFANIDAMGIKAVNVAIGFLTDPRPVETSVGKSTTTTAELAHMYLMHYSKRVAVDPPPKALDVVKLGGVRMKPSDWTELKDLWTKWFADVQAKGKAR